MNSVKTYTNAFLLFDNMIYSNLYLECYNIILQTFDWNVRELFRETCIGFDYKQRETCSKTFFRTAFLKTL